MQKIIEIGSVGSSLLKLFKIKLVTFLRHAVYTIVTQTYSRHIGTSWLALGTKLEVIGMSCADSLQCGCLHMTVLCNCSRDDSLSLSVNFVGV